MQFLTPLALLGGLLAIPIILLYMLRLRRREVLVSSTYLWQQLLRDNEANTPWQRLRRNLLLLLQLLILAALVLALARPFITVPAVSSGQTVLLLDASASMNATDADGRTRFAAAQQAAVDIINGMDSGDSMTIIRVAEVPEVIALSTSDPQALRGAVASALPSSGPADWSGALTLARGSAAGATEFSVVIVSDGGLGDPLLLPEMPGEVTYVPVGQAAENVAITALSTRALPGGRPQLFTQITNYGTEEVEIVYSLDVDGELFASEFYTVPAGENVALVSESLRAFSVIQASLTVPTSSTIPDYLALDNTAWTVPINTTQRRTLLMTPDNLFLEQILRSLPGVDAFRGELDRGLPNQPFDLYIFDSWLPAELPDGDLLIFNPPRSTDLFTVGATLPYDGEAQIARDDPRTEYVNFASVNLLEYRQLSDVAWAQALVRTEGDPLILAGEIDGRQVAIFTFDIHDSDLPLQITWPILMADLFDWFSPQAVVSLTGDLSVGDPLVVRPPFDATAVRVTAPDGTRTDLPVQRDLIVFAGTRQPGLYTLDVLQGATVLQSQPFAVNLFAPGESDITPQLQTVQLGTQTVTSDQREDIGQFEFWPLAALLALLILLIEWYVYHQRLRTPTIMRPLRQRRV